MEVLVLTVLAEWKVGRLSAGTWSRRTTMPPDLVLSLEHKDITFHFRYESSDV